MTRRSFVGGGPGAVTALGAAPGVVTTLGALSAAPLLQGQDSPTTFQMACMTLPYAPFPFARALQGIRAAGYERVAWGLTHPDAAGQRKMLLDVKAGAGAARELAKQSRDAGLTPVMMFSNVMIESADAVDRHMRRIEQAAEAGIPYLLTFGKTAPGEYEKAIACLKEIGPKARASNVMVLIKQHGGNTATGADCSKIIAEVGDEGVRMCYDAGNVLDYESHDPIADIKTCWPDIRAFAMKDHRNWPKDEDCGPGFGEIDHYRLLASVMKTGRAMPMVFENIFEPLKPRPQKVEEVDALARRCREFVESVIAGLRAGVR